MKRTSPVIAAMLAAALAAVAPTATRAQTATVVSGEHATFTRLVFPATPDLEWTIERPESRGAVLRFAAPSLRFDLGTVFDRIPRDRLAAVAADGSDLSLTFGCDCTLSVTQIASDHIVVDIGDPEAEVETAEMVAPAAALPLRLEPVSSLPILLRMPVPDATSGFAPLRAADGSAGPAMSAQVPQIVIREHARVGLLPPAPGSEGSLERGIPTCTLEKAAADLLNRDPADALAGLPALRGAVLDEADMVSMAHMTALAKGYLAIGWGAEAAQVLAGVPADADLASIAAAMDGEPDLAGADFAADPACGPATTTLLLASGRFDADWNAVDEEAFVRFVDRLPPARRIDIEPRLQDSLIRLGHGALLPQVAAVPRLALPHAPASEEIIAAGTDGSAVRATVALLQRGDAAGTPPDAVVIQSALALRPSIPDGPLRAEFEAVLARSLMIAGYLPEMTAVLADGPGLATDLLTDALTSLPPERAIETAIRLRPFMRSDAPGIPRAAALMRRFGLDATARQFEALRSDEDLPPPVRLADVADADGAAALSADDRAWLVRDFAALADDAVAAPTDDTVAADPRRTLARLVAARNVADAETDAVVDDFDRARGALDSSRDLSGAMGRLLEGI